MLVKTIDSGLYSTVYICQVKQKTIMKRLTLKYLGIGAMILLVPGCFLLSHCCSEKCNNTFKSCSTNQKSKQTMEITCSQCGNSTCDINCSAKGHNDSTKTLDGCSLNSSQQNERLEEIRKEIFSKSIKSKEIKNGMEFTFQEPLEFADTLIEFIKFERGCCKDILFDLYFEPKNGPIILTMTESSDIKKMVGICEE